MIPASMNHHRILRALLVACLPAGVLTPVLPADRGLQGKDDQARMAVKVRFEPAKAMPGDTVTLVIDGQVADGYHVYGAKEDVGTVPNLVVGEASRESLHPSGKLKVPDGNLHVDPDIPDLQSHWIEGKTTFKQTFVVKADTKPGVLTMNGGLKYMACTPEMCDPEYTQKITVNLTVLKLPMVHEGNHQTMEVVLTPKTAKPGETVKVSVRVAMGAGWHNYGSKQNPEFGEPVTMKVANTNLESVGSAVVPPGSPHEIVGDTYYFLEDSWLMHQTVKVPLRTKPGEYKVAVKISYTACNDSQCDEPVRTSIGANLVVEAGAVRTDKAKEPDKSTGPPKKQDKPLPTLHIGDHQTMEVVLVPKTARAGEVVTVEVRVQMESGWHNYGSKQDPETGEPTTMHVAKGRLSLVGDAEVPPGELHDIVGDTYHFLDGDWVMRQRVQVPADAKPGDFKIVVDVGYMACDDAMCDETVKASMGTVLTVEAGAVRSMFAAAQFRTEPKSGGDEKAADLEEDDAPADLNQMSLFRYLLLAVGAGLFALMMPCTYPMIPLTVSFFSKQSEIKGGRPVALALVYGGGIVVSYLILGGLLGPWMGKIAADPWLNLVIGVAFVFFAMSLFGLVELKPPQFLMNQATKAQQKASGSSSMFGAAMGVFLMGVTLCITSFACTAPFLGAMLAAGSHTEGTGRLLLGMGVFGLTMALPFVVLSLVPGKLPKSGGWMNSAKILFGFIELAAALKFFSNTELAWNWLILPKEVFLTIWAGLFLVAGIYLLGLIKLTGETGEIGGGRLVTGSFVMGLAGYFALGASGYPLDNEVMNAFNPPYSDADPSHSAPAESKGGTRGGEETKTVKKHTIITDDFDRAIQVAKTSEKLLLVNFTGLL